MGLTIERLELLLLVASVVAILAKRLRVPYSVGLVIAGIALALLPFSPRVYLTRELVFSALLPPLIFEAASDIRWRDLRKDLPIILVLATFGVLLSAGITAAGMHYIARWEWNGALIFGVLIAATDPVSVIAAFKEAGVHGRLRLLVEAESLFNDGSAAVAFGIAMALATGRSLNSLDITKTVFTMAGGSILCGAVIAIAVLLLAGRTQDHLVEITFTTAAAYGSFWIAEHLGLSGVLATLTAGLMVGNLGSLGSFSDRGREAVQAFWQYAAFVSNSLVFLLIGMHEVGQDFAAVGYAAIVAILFVTFGRAVAVYPCCFLFSRSPLRVSLRQQHILFWGGLRGALALALAIGLPPQMPQREEIVSISFAVVAFSIFVQGLTMTPLLRRMGEIVPDRE